MDVEIVAENRGWPVHILVAAMARSVIVTGHVEVMADAARIINDGTGTSLYVDNNNTGVWLRLDAGSNDTSTTATAGAQTLPSNPVGFLVVNISGTNRKIPYYAA